MTPLTGTHTRIRSLALAVAAASVVGLSAWYFHTPRIAVHPIDAVPADAFVAIEVNVGALRKSGALTALFGDRDEQNLTQICGFDPVDRMDDLVFMVPEGSTGAFGVAVQASLSQNQLVGCANEVIKAHGQDPTSDITSRGSYTVITPRSLASDPAKPGRSLGYKAGSPILVAPKSWLYTMVDALDDASEGKGSPGEHVTLRTRLAAEITPTPTFLLTATALLEKSAREKLKTEMLKEVGTADDSGTAMMLGVLGMSSGVLGLYEAGGDVHAVVRLHCEEEPQCGQVEKLVTKVKDDWSRIDALRAFGLGPVIDHVTVSHTGTELKVETSAAAKDVVRWAKLFISSRTGTPPTPEMAGDVDPAAVATANVPSQTVRVKVPEGLSPGQPFTVRIPNPTASSSAAPVRDLPAMPGPASKAPAHGSPPAPPPP